VKLPASQEPAFASIATMPSDEFDAFLEALRSSSPSVSVRDYSERVAAALTEDPEKVYDWIVMLAGAFAAFERSGVDLDQFVSDVAGSAEKKASESLAPVRDWQSARDRLRSLLSLHDTLGLTAKALSVVAESERLYCASRIISDLRPIFRADDSARVSASVVLHSLRIAFHRKLGEDTENFFVTLVSEDLRQLKKVIDRALEKDATLREVASRAGISSLAFRAGEE
jgi:hypothetical protein